jgi:hypothetical protein
MPDNHNTNIRILQPENSKEMHAPLSVQSLFPIPNREEHASPRLDYPPKALF